MGDIHRLPGLVTRLDSPADEVLDRARGGGLRAAVIIGWDEGTEFYFASSIADGADVLWLLEMAKRELLERGLGPS
jgi:hypothetical protein